MGPVDLFIHLLGFAAPAAAVALLVALAGRFLPSSRRPLLSWKAQFALNTAVGVVVLALGLWHFGVDGKMATYSALVVAVAATQWLGSAAWRG